MNNIDDMQHIHNKDLEYAEKLKKGREILRKSYEQRDRYVRQWSRGKILEIGCGEYPLFKNSTKVDIRPFEGGIKYDLNYDFPFKNKSFDIIVGLQIVEIIWDIENFLKECNRILKKNGKIILSTPNVKFWKTRFLLFFGSDKPFEIKQYGAVRFFSPKSLIEFLRKFGFKEDEVHSMGRIPFLSLCGGFIILANKLKDLKNDT